MYYYIRPTENQADSWEDLPADIKDTWDKLGIPAAEKEKLVAGVGAQYESGGHLPQRSRSTSPSRA